MKALSRDTLQLRADSQILRPEEYNELFTTTAQARAASPRGESGIVENPEASPAVGHLPLEKIGSDKEVNGEAAAGSAAVETSSAASAVKGAMNSVFRKARGSFGKGGSRRGEEDDHRGTKVGRSMSMLICIVSLVYHVFILVFQRC